MLKQDSVLHEITGLKPGAKKNPFDPIFTQPVKHRCKKLIVCFVI